MKKNIYSFIYNTNRDNEYILIVEANKKKLK